MNFTYFTAEPILGFLTIVAVFSILSLFLFFILSWKKILWLSVAGSVVQLVLLGAYWMSELPIMQERDAFARNIVASQSVPQSIADGVELVGTSWDGKNLVNQYTVSSSELVPDQDFVKQASCSGSVRVEALALGITLRQSYLSSGGQTTVFDVTLSDCYQP